MVPRINDNQTEESIKPKKSKEIASVDQMLEVVKIKAALEKTHESKRSKKRKKHLENLDKSKSRSDKKYHDEIIDYLRTWKNDKDNWKFQKMKQIFIQNHVFESDIIIGDIWDTTLEYISGSKGNSKDILIEQAEKIIHKIDTERENNKDIGESKQVLYKRARDLLQLLG